MTMKDHPAKSVWDFEDPRLTRFLAVADGAADLPETFEQLEHDVFQPLNAFRSAHSQDKIQQAASELLKSGEIDVFLDLLISRLNWISKPQSAHRIELANRMWERRALELFKEKDPSKLTETQRKKLVQLEMTDARDFMRMTIVSLRFQMANEITQCLCALDDLPKIRGVDWDDLALNVAKTMNGDDEKAQQEIRAIIQAICAMPRALNGVAPAQIDQQTSQNTTGAPLILSMNTPEKLSLDSHEQMLVIARKFQVGAVISRKDFGKCGVNEQFQSLWLQSAVKQKFLRWTEKSGNGSKYKVLCSFA